MLSRYSDSATTKIVGNTNAIDKNQGFKSDIQNMIERYALENVDITRDLASIVSRADLRERFVSDCCESVNANHALQSKEASEDAFYGNYSERLSQLIDNSCNAIANESVMTGYAPIVSYAPFFIKKQWVSCVWKDALMSEVAQSPVLNYKFERRYLKTQDGTLYEIPDVYYNKDAMAKLYSEATGNDLDSDKAITLPATNLCLLPHEQTPGGAVVSYVKGLTTPVHPFHKAETLTPNIAICKVKIQEPKPDGSGWDDTKTHMVNTNIRIDITTHNFVKGEISYTVKDGDKIKTMDDGTSMIAKDELVGKVNFDNGTITVVSTSGAVTEIYISGKTANRFNERSLSVERRIEQLQFKMPESGPRLNTGITIEEASDAISLGKIDMYADTVDMMGDALANMTDSEISSYVQASYEKQKDAENNAMDTFGYESLVEDGGFNVTPYGGYSNNISTWIEDCKEYFERYLDKLKRKLKTAEATVVCVCAPENVRFLRGDVKWIFTDSADVSGLKINYNVGITTLGGDRIHVITSQYLQQTDGIRTIIIPTTTELITFKHVFYSVVIDRNGYRNPVEQLIPNIMATQRTLTFDVLPVQGRFYIEGFDSYSPKEINPQAMYIKNPEAIKP